MYTYSNVYLSVYYKIYLLCISYSPQQLLSAATHIQSMTFDLSSHLASTIASYEYEPLLLATYKLSCVSLHGQLPLTHSYAYSQLAVIGTLLCIARDWSLNMWSFCRGNMACIIGKLPVTDVLWPFFTFASVGDKERDLWASGVLWQIYSRVHREQLVHENVGSGYGFLPGYNYQSLQSSFVLILHQNFGLKLLNKGVGQVCFEYMCIIWWVFVMLISWVFVW